MKRPERIEGALIHPDGCRALCEAVASFGRDGELRSPNLLHNLMLYRIFCGESDPA